MTSLHRSAEPPGSTASPHIMLRLPSHGLLASLVRSTVVLRHVYIVKPFVVAPVKVDQGQRQWHNRHITYCQCQCLQCQWSVVTIYVCLVSFLRYSTSKNSVPLKSGFLVTNPVNLPTLCTSLKCTDTGLGLTVSRVFVLSSFNSHSELC